MSYDCEKISCESKFSTCIRGKDSTDAAAHPGSSTPSSASVVMMYSWDLSKNNDLSKALVPGSKCRGASQKYASVQQQILQPQGLSG